MGQDLGVAFSVRGLHGLISVSVGRNTDPAALGCTLLWPGHSADIARDFPVCRAAVTYPAQGYAAVFGWTQMVRSTDSASGRFEMDPIALYQEIPTPFAWFGIRPELFDAPMRDSRHDMRWEAHSFLCVSPDAVITRRVQAVAGFSWGFAIADSKIAITGPRALGPQAWDSHLDLLRHDYRQWAFDNGYTSA